MVNHYPHPNPNKSLGWIELITGCMFAGKTEEFIRRMRRYRYGKKNVVAFKPIIDQRYSKDQIASHAGTLYPSFIVDNMEEIKTQIELLNKKQKIDVVGIEEVQFFDESIVPFITDLANQGYIMVVDGLDKDYRGNPFQNVDKLLIEAEFVDKLVALCDQCGNIGTRTQRITNGQAAKLNEPLILVDGKRFYEARCRRHWIKPE